MAQTPHDSLFKSTFSNPERAMALALSVLPEQVGRHLDVKSARLVSGSYVDGELVQKHSDLLFEVGFAGRKAFVYLLFEHQSETDARMPWRLLLYMVRVWERWLAEHPSERFLPVLLPIVLSHAQGGWTGATHFVALHGLADEILEDVGPWLLDFRTTVDDLSDVSDEEIRARVVDALGRLVLLVFKHARTSDDLVARLHEWVDLFNRTSAAPHGLEALVRVVRYLFMVGRVPELEVPRLVAGLGVEESVRRVIVTTAEQLIAKGRQEGLAEGEQRGLAHGQRLYLTRLLAARFGPLPPALLERIAEASDDELEQLGVRSFSVRTLDELFSHPG